MKLPLYQVDAFTTRVFAGNPAAIVVLDDWLPDPTMQAIAAENNLAETAFVIVKDGTVKDGTCPLRWFTPAVEVDLCGHATLATADVLFRHYCPAVGRLTFSTRSGELVVSRSSGLLSMDFPSRPGQRVPVSETLATALGTRPIEAVQARDLLVVLDSEDAVRSFRPDFARIGALDAFAVMITARGRDVDFVSRFFAPNAGIPEDPVTGSSHCTLVPYWADRLGKSTLTARQLSARGGELFCELLGDRVVIAGHAVEYLRGEISIEVKS